MSRPDPTEILALWNAALPHDSAAAIASEFLPILAAEVERLRDEAEDHRIHREDNYRRLVAAEARADLNREIGNRAEERAVEALSVLQMRAMHHPVLIDGVWECAWCQTVIESEPCAEWPAETQPDE